VPDGSDLQRGLLHGDGHELLGFLGRLVVGGELRCVVQLRQLVSIVRPHPGPGVLQIGRLWMSTYPLRLHVSPRGSG